MANYYLLQWAQALQHIPYTSTSNKWQTIPQINGRQRETISIILST